MSTVSIASGCMSARYKEVIRCCPSNINRSALIFLSSFTPSTGRSLNLMLPPVRNIIIVPTGYPSEIDAISPAIFLSAQTQPRWNSGNWDLPIDASLRSSSRPSFSIPKAPTDIYAPHLCCHKCPRFTVIFQELSIFAQSDIENLTVRQSQTVSFEHGINN